MTRKLLLADDSVTIQKVVELTFADGNYQVQCVSNGKAAVQKIQDDRPDILLCDVIMPEMNGYDVASFVKRNPAYSAIPVILLTGTFEPFDEEKARLSGADSYITKPFDSKMLVDKVEELLSKRVAFDASSTGSAQVFHSRTEFTLGGPEASSELEFPVAHPEAQEGQLLHAERELLPPEGEESPFAASEPEPAADVEAGRQALHLEAEGLDFRQALPEAAPVVEALTSTSAPAVADMAPADETEIPEAAFEGILEPESPQAPLTAQVSAAAPPPPVATAPPAEVLIAPVEDETWPLETPVPEAPAPVPEPVQESVSGAEDWGQGQTLGSTPEAMLDVPEDMDVTSAAPAIHVEPAAPAMEPAPPASESLVVHDLTDQQSMVAEAQALIEQAPAVHPDVPFMVEPPEPITGAYEMSAPAKADGEPWETIREVQPLQPEEGVETDLAVLAPPVASLGAVGFAPEQVTEIAPAAAAHEETGSTDTGAFPEPSEEPRGAETAPEPEPAPTPSAPVPVLDREAFEEDVRRRVEDLLPGLVATALPGILRARLDETLPGLARAHAAETVPDLVRQAVGDALPAMVPAALEPAVPGHVRSVAEEMAPRIIEQTVNSLAPPLMEKLVREMLPEMVRQVAWEVIPELAESIIKRRIQELESESG